MVDLSTTYMGVKLKNPLIVGSGPTTDKPSICLKAAQSGWGGVVLKTYGGQDVQSRVPFTVTMPRYVLRNVTSSADRAPRQTACPQVRRRGRSSPDR